MTKICQERFLKNFIFLIVIFIETIAVSIGATPTQRHLEVHPLEKISKKFETDPSEKIQKLFEISSRETEDTFFAYHGTTQQFRLFQDVVRSVFEEVLNIPLPENFHFFRIPGVGPWVSKNGIDGFLDEIQNQTTPFFFKRAVIQNFLDMCEKEYGYKLQIKDFSEDEMFTIWNYFQDFIEYAVKKDWLIDAKVYSLPENYPLNSQEFNKNLSKLIATMNNKFSERFPNVDFESFPEWLKKKFSLEHSLYAMFNRRKDDPEDPFGERFDVFKSSAFNPFDDTMEPQNITLVSLNVPIFANYRVSGCFTPKIFFKNESVLGGDEKLENVLEEFFEKIGLNPALVSLLIQEGQNMLSEADSTGGCLLQLFDESALRGEPPFSQLDRMAYVCFKRGVYVPDLIPSKYVQGQYLLKTNDKLKDLELRLLMDNQTTLNPYSALRMIRYDSLSQEDSQKIVSKMKDALKHSAKDEFRIHQYKESLQRLWNVDLTNEQPSLSN